MSNIDPGLRANICKKKKQERLKNESVKTNITKFDKSKLFTEFFFFF